MQYAIGQPNLSPRDSSANSDSYNNPYKERFIDRMFFGGGFGLQFGTQTYVEVAPTVGYRITDKLAAGLGMKYIYYKFDDNFFEYSDHIYGGGPFLRYFLFEELFLHAEHEVLNLRVYDYLTGEYQRKNISSVFLGGGYRQMLGGNSSLEILLLYNVNENRNSPYINPIFRIGFGIGL